MIRFFTGVLPALTLLLVSGRVRADTADTFATIGVASSLAAGAVGVAVNGSALAFDEASARGWRTFGYVAGGLDVVVGGIRIATNDDGSEGVVVGTLAFGMGAAAILTAWFVKEEPRPGAVATPLVLPGGGVGVGVAGRF